MSAGGLPLDDLYDWACSERRRVMERRERRDPGGSSGALYATGGEIRLDSLSAVAFLGQPSGELGFVMDLGGIVNRPPSLDSGPPRTVQHRYLLTPAQAAALVVELLNAARRGGDPSSQALVEALEQLRSGEDPQP